MFCAAMLHSLRSVLEGVLSCLVGRGRCYDLAGVLFRGVMSGHSLEHLPYLLAPTVTLYLNKKQQNRCTSLKCPIETVTVHRGAGPDNCHVMRRVTFR